MADSASLAHRIQNKVRAISGTALHHFKSAYTPVERTTRRFLMDAGLPLRKQFLVLPCMTGGDTSGLFTEVLATIGALSLYERWQRIYAGLRVDYGDQGLYYDPEAGLNWWEYYFEPIAVGTRNNAPEKAVEPHQHDMLTYAAAAMPRAGAHDLIGRYIRLKPHIARKVDAYVRENFEGAFVVGIHYRGTDKHEEAPRVPYEEVVATARKAVEGAKGSRCRLFVATDEQAFLDQMIRLFPGGLLYRPMFRSVDGRPIDVTNDDSNYAKGEDAVMDCVLLARTSCLIRTASNLSLCSTFFNPAIPEILLNQPYFAPN